MRLPPMAVASRTRSADLLGRALMNLDHVLETLIRLGWLLFSSLFALPLRGARFLVARVPAVQAVVLAWAAFLLAPGTAFAVEPSVIAPASSSLPTSLEGFLAWLATAFGIVFSGGGAAAIIWKLVQKEGPSAAKFAASEIPAGMKLLEAAEAKTALAQKYPQALAYVSHQEDMIGDQFAIAFNAQAAQFATVTTLAQVLTLLEGISTTAIKAWYGQLNNEGELVTALEQLGVKTGGTALNWAKGILAGLVKSHSAVQVASDAARAAGPISAAPAPAPKAAGFIDPRIPFAMLLMVLGIAILANAGCTATEKAALKADATAAETDLLSDLSACEAPEIQSQLLAAAPCVDLGSASADLACAGAKGSADATLVALCVTKKAVVQVEGSPITTAQLAKLEAGARTIFANLTTKKKTAPAAAPKAAN